jgi:putative heme-binding domain-containing protein
MNPILVFRPLLSLLFLLLAPAVAPAESGSEDQTTIAVEALRRLKGIDLETNPSLKNVVLRVLASTKGTPAFVELVREFRIRDQEGELLQIAVRYPGETAGVEALRLILENGRLDLLKEALRGDQARDLVRVMGNAGRKELVPLLSDIPSDLDKDAALRKEAVRALARTEEGARLLLRKAKEGALPEELHWVAASELSHARWPQIKQQALRILPVPRAQDAEPLPPVSQLIRQTGDIGHGAEVFARESVGCITCHEVNGKGTNFGPKLSEIGTKLGKEALYESILDPSAGISFGYEGWQIDLKNGDEAYGIIVSETADELAIKAQTGIVTRYPKAEMTGRERMKTSIMPSGLEQTMSRQDLVDLVEYLSSLKKPEDQQQAEAVR